jgi:hypothetical protein
MKENNQNEVWKDIKAIWNKQPESATINIQVSQLISEFKDKIRPFERDLITKDIALIKSLTSDFEKESIRKDITLITSSVKKFIDWLKGN